MKSRFASILVAVALVTSGCALLPEQVSRADAIEACELARGLFDRVPNPKAGQPFTLPGGAPSPLPGVQPSTINPGEETLRSRYGDIRVAAVRSGDSELEEALDSLERATQTFGAWRDLASFDTDDIEAYRSRARSQQREFLNVCRRKDYA